MLYSTYSTLLLSVRRSSRISRSHHGLPPVCYCTGLNTITILAHYTRADTQGQCRVGICCTKQWSVGMGHTKVHVDFPSAARNERRNTTSISNSRVQHLRISTSAPAPAPVSDAVLLRPSAMTPERLGPEVDATKLHTARSSRQGDGKGKAEGPVMRPP